MTIQKGQILNPKGRGARKPVSDAIRALLMRPIEDSLSDKPKTIAQQIALNLVKDALHGENRLSSCKEVIDRVEGKPAQAIIGGEEDDPPVKTLNEHILTQEILKEVSQETIDAIIAKYNVS